MSSNALVTIIAPLDLDRVADAEAAIDVLGNPARNDIRAALDRHEDAEHGTHFASLHAFKSQDNKRAYLAFEFSADGPEADALARIDRQIGEHLRPVFTLANDWKGGELLAYFRSHSVTPGNGWFSSPGLLFAGTPGLTVGRIWREAKLAALVTESLAGSRPIGMRFRASKTRESRSRNIGDSSMPCGLVCQHRYTRSPRGYASSRDRPFLS